MFIQSDVVELVEDMSFLIEVSNCFNGSQNTSTSFFLSESPYPVLTEREKYIEKLNLPVYRLLYNRNMEQTPALNDLENKYKLFQTSKD